ncbi:MAG: transposase domain-containing protein [Rhodoferax sp.]
MGTAKRAGIEPHVYLRYVLERIGNHSVNRIDELLPWNMQAVMNTNPTDQPLAA